MNHTASFRWSLSMLRTSSSSTGGLRSTVLSRTVEGMGLVSTRSSLTAIHSDSTSSKASAEVLYHFRRDEYSALRGEWQAVLTADGSALGLVASSFCSLESSAIPGFSSPIGSLLIFSVASAVISERCDCGGASSSRVGYDPLASSKSVRH